MENGTVGLPYWNVNIPPAQRTDECPDFLRVLSKKDEGIIGTRDDEFVMGTWDAVRKLVETNRLDLFQRVPSELRRYLAYNWKLKQDYGSVMNFVLAERLQWTLPVVAQGKPFEHASDIKILWNDWPYGIDTKIVHIVVWTKFDLEEDPDTGDLTAVARQQIQDFVQSTFGPRLSPDKACQSPWSPKLGASAAGADTTGHHQKYVWFKNWRSLKSVHAVEHFHVMLYDPPADFVEKLTNGDVPLSRRQLAD